MRQQAKPFVKWAGGKGQLLTQLDNYLPPSLKYGTIEQYVEPFLGGGAVFFWIAQHYKFKTAYLSDNNADLVALYKVVQQAPEKLLAILADYQQEYDNTQQEMRNELYLSVREKFNNNRRSSHFDINTDESILRAAQFIFLNKTCFNGLFRINSKGGFNVPYGKYKTAIICDKTNIILASRLLQKAEIHHHNYLKIDEAIKNNAFIYFDPPYRPISPTASFTSYTSAGFGEEDQKKLALFVQELGNKTNAQIMLSNSDPTPTNPHDTFFEKNYSNCNLYRVSASRAINSDGSKRGKITELLITNYQHEPQSLGLNF